MLGHRAIGEGALAALLVSQVTVTHTTIARFASIGFVTRPTDSPAHEFIPGRITRGLTLGRRLNQAEGGQFGALLETSFGEIELANPDGALDSLVNDYFADGRMLRLKIGATEIDQHGRERVKPYASFATVYTSVAGEWSFEHDVLRLRIRDLSNRLKDRLQQQTYSGEGGKNGTADMAGRTLPTAFGRCENVPAQLVDPAILTYQMHGGRMDSIITVWDAGIAVPFDADYASYAALESATVPAGTYASCLAEGFIRLGSIPTGSVTAHIRGDTDNITGNFVSLHGSIMRMILRDYGGLATNELNNDSFNDLNAVRPGAMGLFLPAGDQSTVLEVIERIAFSAGAFAGQDRSGLYRAQLLDIPSSLAHWTFTDRDIVAIEREQLPYGVPWKARGVGYHVNWSVQGSSELATGVSQSRRQFLESEYRFIYTQNPAIALAHQTSTGAPLRRSLFLDQIRAEEEAQRLIELYSLGRSLYRVTVKTVLFSVEIGQTVRLVYDRWNLGSGQNFVVIGIEDNADTIETELLLFGAGTTRPFTNVIWSATPTASDIGTNWTSYVNANFDSVATDQLGTIASAPDGSPALRALFPVASNYGFNSICEQLIAFSPLHRGSVTLRYEVFLDSGVDYLTVTDLGGSQTLAFLTFPGLVGGQTWPGANGFAYPTGGDPQEGDNWSARIRVAGSGKIGPYLYVQNRPGAFGWHRTTEHPLRLNDLRGGWSVWEQTCVMNTPGVADGKCTLTIDGAVIVDVSDIEYRSTDFDTVVANGIRLQAHIQGQGGIGATTAFDYWTRGYSIEFNL